MQNERNIEEINYEDLGNAVEIARVTNEFEADILISKLRAFDIPAFLSFPGESGAAKTMCGRSNLTIRIMAPETKADEAKEILFSECEYDFSEAENFTPPEEAPVAPFLTKAFLYLVAIAVTLLILAFFASR